MNLEELEKKYEELGAEIERLKSQPKNDNNKKRWRAEKGEKYFTVSGVGEVGYLYEGDNKVDNFRHAAGNYFKTREEAELYHEEHV